MALATRARSAGILLFCLLVLSSFSATGALATSGPPRTAELQEAAVIVIGSNSCVGTDACTGAVGPIGDNSCNGALACYQAFAVGDNSCNGDSACVSPAGSIGEYSCNGDHACKVNSGNVGYGSCNGANACVINLSTGIGNCAINFIVPAICNYWADARIRRIGRHTLVGNDIYNTDGTDQTLSDTLGDRAVRFVITIQNDGAVADSFTLHSSNGVFALPLPPVNFYHGWPAQDITAAVMAGTYTTPTIAPGGVHRIRAVVRPSQINFNHLAAGPGVPHYSWLVTATSVGYAGNVDAVRFAVDVPFN